MSVLYDSLVKKPFNGDLVIDISNATRQLKPNIILTGYSVNVTPNIKYGKLLNTGVIDYLLTKKDEEWYKNSVIIMNTIFEKITLKIDYRASDVDTAILMVYLLVLRMLSLKPIITSDIVKGMMIQHINKSAPFGNLPIAKCIVKITNMLISFPKKQVNK